MKDLALAFKDKKILIIGDVMIDRYLNGRVDRISPEAPVPVVGLEKETNKLGGAANVALNIKSLGARPILVSVIGKDLEGDLFQQLLAKADIKTPGILSVEHRPTTVKTRVIAGGQHLLRIDHEVKDDIDTSTVSELTEIVRSILHAEKIDAILFQDYNKGVLTEAFIHNIIELAKATDIPTIVDPKFKNFFAYKGVHLFKPNLKEIQQVTPFDVKINLEHLRQAALYVEERLDNAITMITLSEHGVFFKQGDTCAIVPTSPRIIADVCGAGDAVISVSALGMASQIDINTIAQISNIAGGLVCEEIGVVPVAIEKIIAEMC